MMDFMMPLKIAFLIILIIVRSVCTAASLNCNSVLDWIVCVLNMVVDMYK